MARKSQRKKASREEAHLQVELLDDGSSSEQDLEGEGAVERGPEEDAKEPADRWAKAVGQLGPGGGKDRKEEAADAGAADGGDRSGDEAPDEHSDPILPSEVHVSARDHAAATVRPAGQPLARARDLVGQGRIHEAMELYLGILTVNPSNLKAHNNLGVLLDELKQFDAALEHFEAAARLAPDNVEVLANHASTLTSLARYDEAEELLRKAQRLSPEDLRARLGIGILQFRRGLYAQAEAELSWACERDAGNGQAFYYRGEALNRLGRFEEAHEALKRAVGLMPDDPRPYYTLGHLHDRRHEPQEAAEMYRTARRLQGS